MEVAAPSAGAARRMSAASRAAPIFAAQLGTPSAALASRATRTAARWTRPAVIVPEGAAHYARAASPGPQRDAAAASGPARRAAVWSTPATAARPTLRAAGSRTVAPAAVRPGHAAARGATARQYVATAGTMRRSRMAPRESAAPPGHSLATTTSERRSTAATRSARSAAATQTVA